jgi:hypothetical protein
MALRQGLGQEMTFSGEVMDAGHTFYTVFYDLALL